jgi:general stress protein 26
MAPLRLDGVKSIWFATEAGSSKVQEILKDGNAVIYAEAPRNAGECRLWGNIEVLSDAVSKKKVWSEELRAHFPDGVNSPEMRVLRFDVSNGIYVTTNRELFDFKH